MRYSYMLEIMYSGKGSGGDMYKKRKSSGWGEGDILEDLDS